ncbi:MAG TPA: SRPBCC family protein [Solirubrobacteraceae bacterium]|nr:SRPBCC family protein [Solirubrobacteraceae bacterium]
MKLQNSFTVPAPVERAWEILLDLERVAPCLPGAELDVGDGREFEGRMAIKIGPVVSRYAGTVRIEEADADARRAVMRAQARDARGAGTAAATIATEMHPTAEGTRVDVETDIQISGPAAQFGRGVMQEVSSKLMGRFADCLAAEMAAEPAGPGAAAAARESVPSGSGAGAASPAGPDAAWSAERAAQWAAAPGERAPTQLGGYDETPVGRLPTGPAGDAAVAAAAAASVRERRPPRARPSDDVLDLGEISRGAVLKRVVPVVTLVAAAIAGALVWRAQRRARRVRRRGPS